VTIILIAKYSERSAQHQPTFAKFKNWLASYHFDDHDQKTHDDYAHRANHGVNARASALFIASGSSTGLTE